jgi:hypothetical protein
MDDSGTDNPDLVRTGVCVVRAEVDGATGLIITVTSRPDLDDEARTSTLRTTAADAALARVAEFLAQCGGD